MALRVAEPHLLKKVVIFSLFCSMSRTQNLRSVISLRSGDAAVGILDTAAEGVLSPC